MIHKRDTSDLSSLSTIQIIDEIIRCHSLDEALDYLESSRMDSQWSGLLRKLSRTDDPVIALAITREYFFGAIMTLYTRWTKKTEQEISDLEDKALMSASVAEFLSKAVPDQVCETVYETFGPSEDKPAVRISSIYAARCMEAKIVIVPDLSPNRWPGHYSVYYVEGHAERDRLLLYAAVSRACEKVYLMRSDVNPRYLDESENHYILKDVPSSILRDVRI